MLLRGSPIPFLTQEVPLLKQVILASLCYISGVKETYDPSLGKLGLEALNEIHPDFQGVPPLSGSWYGPLSQLPN